MYLSIPTFHLTAAVLWHDFPCIRASQTHSPVCLAVMSLDLPAVPSVGITADVSWSESPRERLHIYHTHPKYMKNYSLNNVK